MTTAIIHGDPGSYKTASLVSDYLVPAVKQGRVIVTNIRGVKTPQEIAEIFGFDAPSSSEIYSVSFDDKGFDQMATFFHWAPPGALILMDEGQRVYPTRLRDFDQFDNHRFPDRPSTVENAFDTHRHQNWDIFISTPSISKIHKEIRAVSEFGYRHKNMASLFSFLKGRYKRVTHLADNSGTSLSHAMSTNFRKIDPRVFNVYQSTATGQHQDTQSKISLFKQPKIMFLLLCITLAVGSLVSNISSNGVPAMLGGTPKQNTVSTANPSFSQVPAVSPVRPVSGDVSAREIDSNPFAGLKIYFTGRLNNKLFFEVLFPDKTYLSIDSDQMMQLGFKFRYVAPNDYALLYFDNHQIVALPKPQERLLAQIEDKFQSMPQFYRPDTQ